MAAAPLAVVVQATRHEVLAGAGLAIDDNIGRRGRERPDELANAFHLHRAADQRGLDALPALELLSQ